MRLLCTTLAIASVLGIAAVASADSIQGSYVEARSTACPSPRDAASQANQTTRVVLAWQVRQGVYDGEKLDGQTVIAVVSAEPSPGGAIGQTKTVFFVDTRVTASQERALVRLAKDLAPAAIHDAGDVRRSKLDVRIAEGCGCGAAVVECNLAKFRTRRMTDADIAPAKSGNPTKPLGDVFSSTQSIATEYLFEGIPAADAPSAVTTFTGSFSR